jgi:rhodanese-related sulfurtransferase
VFVALAILCAIVSNALAGPERKLKWVGSYADEDAVRPQAQAQAQAATAPARSPGKAVTPAASTTPLSAPSAPNTSAGRAFAPHPDKAWVEISGDDVAALFTRGGVPFFDARRTSVYRDGHIAGARSISVWESDADEKVKALYQEGLDPSAPIVVYCSGGECEDSHMLAQKLYFVGFDNVLVYKDGFPDWQKRGLPVHKGDQP